MPCLVIIHSCVLSSCICVQLFATPWTIAHQAPLSKEVSRQEHWNGLPYPSSGDLPDPGIGPMSLVPPSLAGRLFTTSATWEDFLFLVAVFLVIQSCLTLWDTMDCSRPGLPVPHHLPEFAQVHVHCMGDAIQPSRPLTPSSPSVLNLSQHQGLFQWVRSLHHMTKILELRLQHQPFQWVFRVDLP